MPALVKPVEHISTIVKQVITENPALSHIDLQHHIYRTTGQYVTQNEINRLRSNLIKAGLNAPKLVSGGSYPKGTISNQVRQEFMANPGITKTDVSRRFLSRGIKVSESLIYQIYEQLVSQKKIVKDGPSISLNSPKAIIARAIVNQGNKPTKKVLEELETKGIVLSEKSYLERRRKLDQTFRLGLPPFPRKPSSKPLKPLPVLNASQEKVLTEIKTVLPKMINRTASAYRFSPAFKEDFEFEAQLLAHRLAAKYDSSRRLETYLHTSVSGLALELMRNKLRIDLGLRHKESRALFALLGATNRNEDIKPILARYKLTLAEANELLEAHERLKRQLPFQQIYQEK